MKRNLIVIYGAMLVGSTGSTLALATDQAASSCAITITTAGQSVDTTSTTASDTAFVTRMTRVQRKLSGNDDPPMEAAPVQKKKELPPYRHDFRIGIGYPAPGPNDPDFPFSRKDRGMWTPNINLTYGYAPINQLQVTITCSYNRHTWSESGAMLASAVATSFSSDTYRISPALRGEWLRRGMITMYSEIGFTYGMQQFKASDGGAYFTGWFTWNVTPFGMTVGRKLFGFAELLSFGPRGIVNAGIGYRF